MIKLPILQNTDATEDRPADPSRRNFLGAIGASISALSISACIRKPVEKILPYAKRPEDLIPGKPMYFASSMAIGSSVLGLIVESHEGRPTKIDGNPKHPMSRGGTHPWAQAAVLDLYDPNRVQKPLRRGAEGTSADLFTWLDQLAKRLEQTKGNGLAILTEDRPSPTYRRLLKELVAKYPGTKIYTHDVAGTPNTQAGTKLAGAGNTSLSFGGEPDVIVTFDADYLGTEGDVVKNQRDFTDGRRVLAPSTNMNRLYSIESRLTITGMNADHRLRAQSRDVAPLLALLAQKLNKGIAAPNWGAPITPNADAFISALAQDLAARPAGKTLVVVGERQPPHVHVLGHLINQALGNTGKTVVYNEDDRPESGDAAALAHDIMLGRVRQLVIVGGNPAYDAPSDVGLDVLIRQVPATVHLTSFKNETSALTSWVVPRSHFLEFWSDLRSRDGTVAIQQPLVAPLYESISEQTLIARLLGNSAAKDHDLVRDTWRSSGGADFEKSWRRWLHAGVVDGAQRQPVMPELNASGLAGFEQSAQKPGGFEINFALDPSVLDGRFAGNPWMQELPDPITKLTWDNAALLSPATAKRIGVKNHQRVRVTFNGRQVQMPAWIVPGTAEDTVVLPLGYGRKLSGPIAEGAGFDVYPLRRTDALHFGQGATIEPLGDEYMLATTQVEGGLHGRNHVREATLEEYAADPQFVDKQELMDKQHIHSMWLEPNPKDGQQWGMTIDLNVCTGCSACSVACQAENNIPWVGKREVMNGREMHWIRIDRYFEGTDDAIDVRVQPMACVQCETAPCENVCPVAATAHSPDGLNDMAYNRCIGTRYCANNCPYKVRRFNFFNFAGRNDEQWGPAFAMQRNPDVTVRFRGVMEKCTYCVQRVQAAKIDAKRLTNGVVPDGTIVPACAQACPTNAIVFGDVNDPESKVSKLKALPRNYGAIGELNTRPRTTYLARLSNPNPNLKQEKAGA